MRSRVAQDPADFSALWRRYRRVIYAVALRFAPSPSDADEIAQETLVQLHRKLGSFRGDSSLTSWVHAVAVNAARMHLRRNRRHERGREEVDETVADEGVVRLDEWPEAKIDQRDLARKAAAAVHELPDHYRLPFLLRAVDGLSAAETGAIAGISAGLVRQRVLRARRMLQKRMLPALGD